MASAQLTSARLVREAAARVEFLKCNAEAGLEGAQMKELSQSAARGMCSMILGMKGLLTAGDATALLNLCRDGPFDKEGGKLIITAVNSKMQWLGNLDASEPVHEETKANTAADLQVHMHFDNYMREPDWNTLEDKDMDLGAKSRVIVQVAKNIGLVRCSEKTYVHLSSVLLVLFCSLE